MSQFSLDKVRLDTPEILLLFACLSGRVELVTRRKWRNMIRNAMAWFCSALVVCSPVWAQQSEQGPFKLVVVRGDDAQNNIKKGRATKAVVEVRDRNDKPVAGVAVLFLLPDSGAGGSFVTGSQTASVTTDNLGQAAVTYKPNNVPGQFNLKASLKTGSNDSSVNIKQSNLSAQARGGPSNTALVVIAVAAAGIGIGLGVGLNQGGGSTRANSVTLTPGGPSVGPPK